MLRKRNALEYKFDMLFCAKLILIIIITANDFLEIISHSIQHIYYLSYIKDITKSHKRVNSSCPSESFRSLN